MRIRGALVREVEVFSKSLLGTVLGIPGSEYATFDVPATAARYSFLVAERRLLKHALALERRL